MKKEYKVFYFVFILFILVISLSLYIAKQSLIKTHEQPEGVQTQNIPDYPSAVSTETQPIKAEIERKKPEQKAKEAEFDLSQISEASLKEIEKSQPQEEAQSPEEKLNTQPPLQKLKELRIKGAVVY